MLHSLKGTELNTNLSITWTRLDGLRLPLCQTMGKYCLVWFFNKETCSRTSKHKTYNVGFFIKEKLTLFNCLFSKKKGRWRGILRSQYWGNRLSNQSITWDFMKGKLTLFSCLFCTLLDMFTFLGKKDKLVTAIVKIFIRLKNDRCSSPWKSC